MITDRQSTRSAVVSAGKKIANRFGFDVRNAEYTVNGRRRINFQNRHVNHVLDVGANEGQYGHDRRLEGYRGWITSWEPNPESADLLERKFLGNDKRWALMRAAIGREETTARLFLTRNTQSNSLVRPSLHSGAEFSILGEVQVAVRTLDLEVKNLKPGIDLSRSWLKVDVQGYERDVIAGAGEVLSSVAGAEFELCLSETYEGQALLGELVESLSQLGLRLKALEPVWWDESGALAHLNGLFERP